MEHGQGPEIDRGRVQAESQGVAQGVEIATAMMVDHALRIAGGARGIEQAHRVPFVVRPRPRKIGIAAGEQILVDDLAQAFAGRAKGIVDIDHQQLASQGRQRRAHDVCIVAVGDQRFRLAVLEAERDRLRIEAVVERIEHGADSRNGVMRLQQRRHVGRHDRNRIAAADSGACERRSEPPAARLELAVGIGQRAVAHRDLVRPDERAALQELHR